MVHSTLPSGTDQKIWQFVLAVGEAIHSTLPSGTEHHKSKSKLVSQQLLGKKS